MPRGGIRGACILLAPGADPLSTDEAGATPLDLSRANRSSHREREPFDRVEALLTVGPPS